MLAHLPKFMPLLLALAKRSGKQLVPYLEDPNTGTKMFESLDIAAYLNTTYAI